MTKPMKDYSDAVKVVTVDGKVYDAAGLDEHQPVLGIVHCYYSGVMVTRYSPNKGPSGGVEREPFANLAAAVKWVIAQNNLFFPK